MLNDMEFEKILIQVHKVLHNFFFTSSKIISHTYTMGRYNISYQNHIPHTFTEKLVCEKIVPLPYQIFGIPYLATPVTPPAPNRRTQPDAPQSGLQVDYTFLCCEKPRFWFIFSN